MNNTYIILNAIMLFFIPFIILRILVSLYMTYSCVNIALVFFTIILHIDFIYFIIIKTSKKN